jgi:diacylglycerol kinase
MNLIKTFKNRLLSFKCAFAGLKLLFIEETNARIHLVITILVLGLGLYFDITSFEWLIIILTIGLVISMEAVNTSIEKLCNEVTLEHKTSIKIIKDLAAGAVLITAICAITIGGIIFIPYLLKISSF